MRYEIDDQDAEIERLSGEVRMLNQEMAEVKEENGRLREIINHAVGLGFNPLRDGNGL